MNPLMRVADKVLGQRETATPMPGSMDPSQRMKAVVWHGKRDVRYEEVPRPMLNDARDALIQVTATTICGSDLHLYSGNMPNMKEGDIVGHEFMGIIIEVGSAVETLKKGDRVVVAFNIACGQCEFCQRKEFSVCKTTNPSQLMKEQYGHRTSALFGYSHLTGGVPGGQSEFVRVPFADVNCLVVPDNVPDEMALFLSDIVPTAYYGAEMGNVGHGDTVAIWGLGPVGLLCAKWCQLRGASRVIGIDCVPERLDLAKRELNIEVINFREANTVETLQRMFPDGLDVGIECAGFEYATTWRHKVEMAVGLETDTADLLTEIITCVRPCGRISILGVYIGTCNHFPIGAFMEKGLTMRGGQSPTQRFWRTALAAMEKGEFDPRFVVTTRGRLADAPELYKAFERKEHGVIKVFLRPDTLAQPQVPR